MRESRGVEGTRGSLWLVQGGSVTEEWSPMFSQLIETGDAAACSGMRAIDAIVTGVAFRLGCFHVVPRGAFEAAGGRGEGAPGPPEHRQRILAGREREKRLVFGI